MNDPARRPFGFIGGDVAIHVHDQRKYRMDVLLASYDFKIENKRYLPILAMNIDLCCVNMD